MTIGLQIRLNEKGNPIERKIERRGCKLVVAGLSLCSYVGANLHLYRDKLVDT